MWPLGYDANERTLVINPARPRRYAGLRSLCELGCVRRVKKEADLLGLRTKCQHDNEWHRARRQTPSRGGHLYTLLSTRFTPPHSSQVNSTRSAGGPDRR